MDTTKTLRRIWFSKAELLSFHRIFFSTRLRRAGFTLFEIMIVMVILGGLMAVGLGRMGKTQKNVKTVMREMSVMGKEIRHRARLKSQTYRLVLEMPEKGTHRYWVETAPGVVLASTDPKKKKSDSDKEKEKSSSPFKKDDNIIKKEKELPNGIFFKQVDSIYSESPVTEGIAYVHFSPTGLVEEAGIQVTDKKNLIWTLIFNPLTGQSDVVEEAYNIRDKK